MILLSKRTIYVTSYENPDTDGMACAIGYSRLMSDDKTVCLPSMRGSLSDETKLVLETTGFDYEKMMSSGIFDKESKIAVVDTHNKKQIPFVTDLDNVIEVIDHHPDGDDRDFPNAIVTNMRIGAAASIIADRCLRKDIVDEKLAFLFQCAIISNTVNFTSPSTSEYDRNVFKKLERINNFDEMVIERMKEANDKQILKDISSSITRETKRFDYNGREISISQLELHSHVDTEMESKVIESFNRTCNDGAYMLSIVCLSDEKTVFVSNEEGKFIIEKLFPGTIGNKHTENRILLRKSFILPKLKEKKMSVGVIHGRFQCLHNDHMKYLLEGKKRCDFLYVGITNFDRSNSGNGERFSPESNPFSYLERTDMIRGSLIEAGLSADSFTIIPFPIEHPECIAEYAPRDATYFVTSYDDWGEKKLDILNGLGLKVDLMWSKDISEKGCSASDVRNLIKEGKEWKHLVPSFVYKYITENKLDERIRRM